MWHTRGRQLKNQLNECLTNKVTAYRAECANIHFVKSNLKSLYFLDNFISLFVRIFVKIDN